MGRHRHKIYALIFLALFSCILQGDRSNNNSYYIQVLNHKSRPVVGEEWTVQFITNGSGELVIENHNPDEVEFVGLECESVVVVGGRGVIVNEKVDGYKQEGSKIKVDWHYGMGKAIFRPLKPGGHKLEFSFGNNKDAAFNQTTEVVSTESTNVSCEPAVALDSTNVYITWHDETDYGGSGTDPDIFFKSKPIGGVWPATSEVVSTESTAGSGWPSIAVDSTNVYITWRDWTDYGGAGADYDIFFKSKPIGGSWPATSEVVSTESTDWSLVPAITVDSTNVYITWSDWTDYGGSGGDRDIFFKSKPIGGSWPVVTEVVSTESTDNSYDSDIALDSTNVYITWHDYTDYGGSGADWDIFFKSKLIGGSWPATTEVVSAESTDDSYDPGIAVDSTNVYITWYDYTNYGGSGADRDIFFKSKLIGGSWPAATEVVSMESTGPSYSPAIAVDSTNVYITWLDWTDYGGAGTDGDIFFKSKPIGGSWPVTTEVVSTESTNESFSPAIAVDSTDEYITWHDDTDYGGAGTDGDIFFKGKLVYYSPTITLTATVSASITPTATISPTPTISVTYTVTPTASPTGTWSSTSTASPTWSPTPTASPTYSCSSTRTASPTITWTPTITRTPTITVTSTISPIFTFSPTATSSPTVTEVLTPMPEILVFPNPFNPGKAQGGLLKFWGLPEKAKVSIYTVSGELVRKLSAEGTKAYWDGRTEGGKLVSMGTYYYVIEAGKRVEERGRIAVVR